MITKSITIDEKKIYEEIMTSLDEKYHLVYIDYRDEIPAKDIQTIIDDQNLESLTDEDYWFEHRYYNALGEIRSIMEKKGYSKEQIDLFLTTDEAQELRMEIESRDESTPEVDALKQTPLKGYIRFHSNYDCWLPIWEQGGIIGYGSALTAIMGALSLNPTKVKAAALKCGIKTLGVWRNVPSREGNELVDYDAFINVLVETPGYGNWSFFGKLEMGELIEASFDIDSLTIPKGTTCAMYNWWNGSGSLDFCETLRPVTVAELKKRLLPYKDKLKLVIDDKQNKKYGYVPCDVYGGPVSSDTLLTNSK